MVIYIYISIYMYTYKELTRNLKEMWKVLLRKSSKLSSKKLEIGEILAGTH